MRVAVIGATGSVGSRVTEEACLRGHCVVAAARRVEDTTPRAGVTAVACDASDEAQVFELLSDLDAAVLTIRAVDGQGDVVVDATASVLRAAARARARVLVVGGAGPLLSPNDPGRLVQDDPDFVPSAWRDSALTSTDQLRACEQNDDADWTYLSPPALLRPGTRTGRFRIGTRTLLVDDAGASAISVEDLAVAVVNELEVPSGARRLTFAY